MSEFGISACTATNSYSLLGPFSVSESAVLAALQSPDAISVAMQLGRLDLVSILLAILVVVISVASALAYAAFRSKAVREAKKELTRIAPELLRDYIKQNPYILISAIQSSPYQFGIMNSPITETDFSQEIAVAMEGEKNGD